MYVILTFYPSALLIDFFSISFDFLQIIHTEIRFDGEYTPGDVLEALNMSYLMQGKFTLLVFIVKYLTV